MIKPEQYWQMAIPGVSPRPGEIHVWQLLLPAAGDMFKEMKEVLSAEEWSRACSFHFEKDRSRYVIARGALRRMLAGYLGRKPGEIVFSHNPWGKPMLQPEQGLPDIRFNLSHSGDRVLFVFAIGRHVGIDIEKVREGLEFGHIAENFFSAGETSTLEGLPQKERPKKFFQYWTRKEALIKALGKGMSSLQENFDVSPMDAKEPMTGEFSGIRVNNSSWHIFDLLPGEGYAAAICTEGSIPDISYWQYPC